MELLRWIAAAHGVYYVLSGVWPLLNMASFLRVTGPKHDLWLVRTVAVMVTAIGASLATAAWRGSIGLEILVLATFSAAGFIAIECVYVFKRTIGKVYLLDTILEVMLLGAWAIAWSG